MLFLTLATGTGRTLEHVLTCVPANAVAKVANRLSHDTDLAESGTELALGAAEFTGSSFLNAMTRRKLGRQAKGAAEVIDAHFPSEIMDEAVLNVKRRIADVFNRVHRGATDGLGEGEDTSTRESRIRISAQLNDAEPHAAYAGKTMNDLIQRWQARCEADLEAFDAGQLRVGV